MSKTKHRITPKDKKKILSAQAEVSQLVKKISDVILEHVTPLDKTERWLIASRAINSVFNAHYRVSLVSAEERLKEIEEKSK